MTVSPICNQLMVAMAPLLAALSAGGTVTFPSALLYQLKGNDSSIPLDFETASWVGSIHGLAGIPSILVPAIMQWKGRKCVFLILCLAILTGWISAYFAQSATLLLIGESLHGFGSNSLTVVICLSITEMMTPKYRDSFIQIYYTFEIIAMLSSGFLIPIVYWRTITIIMGAPMLLAFVLALMWPESPYWLALKGDFSRSATVFTWLRGSGDLATKELNEMINTAKSNVKDSNSPNFKEWCRTIVKREFYLPCLHMILLQGATYGSGAIVTIIYAIPIVEAATNIQFLIKFGGVIVNMILLTGFSICFTFQHNFNKRTMVLISAACTVFCCLGVSTFSLLKSLGIVSGNSLACIVFFILYVASVSFGVMPFPYSIASSLMPVKYRGFGGIMLIINSCVMHSLTLKLAPYFLHYTKLEGLFLFFAIVVGVCGVLMWKYIPEIKDRTLGEIENYYTHGTFNFVADKAVMEPMVDFNTTSQKIV